MYLEHFGLSDFPFIQSGKDELFFESPPAKRNALRIHHWLDCGHDFLLVSGDPGTGRLSLVKYALATSPYTIRIADVTALQLSDVEFLQYIALELDVETEATDLMTLRHRIKQHLRRAADSKSRIGIIVQGAENRPESQIQLLKDIATDPDYYLPLCSVVLIGDARIGGQQVSDQEQNRAGPISCHVQVGPLNETMTSDYLKFRLSLVADEHSSVADTLFSKELAWHIYHLSRGNIAAINRLADLTLLAAFADKKPELTTHHVRDAMRTLGWGGTDYLPVRVREPLVAAEMQPSRSDPATTKLYIMESDVTTIGRAADCTIRIEGEGSVPCHAIIMKTPAGLVLRSESNGDPVYLNSSPIGTAPFKLGDTLRVAEYEFKLERADNGQLALVEYRDASVT